MSLGSFATIEALLESNSDADDVLRGVVSELVRSPAIAWAGISFLEDGALALGPEAGSPDPARRLTSPVSFQGAVVGELAVDGTADPAALAQLCSLIAAHVLLGWDTRGEIWDP